MAGRGGPGRVRWERAVSLALSLLASGCFEPPVVESMALRFDESGHLEVNATTRIASGEAFQSRRAVRERLDAAREAALRGEDLWARPIRLLAPARERLTLGWEKGELREVARSAWFPDGEPLARLFSDLPVAAFVTVRDREWTLEIHPAATLRASAKQRATVTEAFESFSARLAAYLSSTAVVYRYLEERPDRARDVLAAALVDRVGERGVEGVKLETGEEEIATALRESMRDLTTVLRVPEEEAYTLDELSRLVHDPFPMSLSVEVPGTVVESAGFRRVEGSTWKVPSMGLWGALVSLEGRWVSPEPILVVVSPEGRSADGPFDVAEFASRPRKVVARPTAAEVKLALEVALRPAEVYRLRWRLPARTRDQAPEGAGRLE